MATTNVLPSAPQYSDIVTQSPPLYPVLADDNSNFRLKKIFDMKKELKQQADHYWQEAKKKKYKKHTICPTTLPLRWQGLRRFSSNWRWRCRWRNCKRSSLHRCRWHWLRLNWLCRLLL